MFQIHRDDRCSGHFRFRIYVPNICSEYELFRTYTSSSSPGNLFRIPSKLPGASHLQFRPRKGWKVDFWSENSRILRRYRYHFGMIFQADFTQAFRLKILWIIHGINPRNPVVPSLIHDSRLWVHQVGKSWILSPREPLTKIRFKIG